MGPGLREQLVQERQKLDNLHCLGEVILNNDPKQLHRVKVRVKGIYDDVPDSDLPWALPAITLMMGNTSTCGSFGVPIIGSLVYVVFLGGDVSIPLYFGAPYTPDTKRPEANTNYPTRYGWIDETGNKFVVDRTSGEIFLLHKSGTQYHIADNGDITVTGVANRTKNISANETVTIGGDKSETIDGNVVVTIGVNATINVTGNAVISVDGTTELTTSQTTINSPVTINGNTIVNGSVSASGNVSDGTSSMATMRSIYNSHKHPENDGGNMGNTSPPNEQMS